MATHEIELSRWRRFNHFQLTFFFAPVALFSAGLWLGGVLHWTDPRGASRIAPVAMVFGALAVLSYRWEKRGLRFQVYETPRDPESNAGRVRKLAEAQGWNIDQTSELGIMKASTPNSSPLWSWAGEQVTIRFVGSQVWVNSISDLSRKGSLASWAQNPRNIALVAEAVEGRLMNG